MKWTRLVSTDVRVTPWRRVEGLPEWKNSGIAAVRIWIQTDGRRWWQSHEWEKAGGNGERYSDGWIACPVRSWPTNAAEPEPGDEPPRDQGIGDNQ